MWTSKIKTRTQLLMMKDILNNWCHKTFKDYFWTKECLWSCPLDKRNLHRIPPFKYIYFQTSQIEEKYEDIQKFWFAKQKLDHITFGGDLCWTRVNNCYPQSQPQSDICCMVHSTWHWSRHWSTCPIGKQTFIILKISSIFMCTNGCKSHHDIVFVTSQRSCCHAHWTATTIG